MSSDLVLYDDKKSRLVWDGCSSVQGFRYQGLNLFPVGIRNNAPIKTVEKFEITKQALNKRATRIEYDGFMLTIAARALGGAQDGKGAVKLVSLDEVKSGVKDIGPKATRFDPENLPGDESECVKIIDKLRAVAKLDEVSPSYNHESLMQVKLSVFALHPLPIVQYASLESLITLLQRPYKTNQRLKDLLLTERQLAKILNELRSPDFAKINLLLIVKAYRLTLEKMLSAMHRFKEAPHATLNESFYKGKESVIKAISKKEFFDVTYQYEYEFWFIKNSMAYLREHEVKTPGLLNKADRVFSLLIEKTQKAEQAIVESGVKDHVVSGIKFVAGLVAKTPVGFLISGLSNFVDKGFEDTSFEMAEKDVKQAKKWELDAKKRLYKEYRHLTSENEKETKLTKRVKNALYYSRCTKKEHDAAIARAKSKASASAGSSSYSGGSGGPLSGILTLVKSAFEEAPKCWKELKETVADAKTLCPKLKIEEEIYLLTVLMQRAFSSEYQNDVTGFTDALQPIDALASQMLVYDSKLYNDIWPIYVCILREVKKYILHPKVKSLDQKLKALAIIKRFTVKNFNDKIKFNAILILEEIIQHYELRDHAGVILSSIYQSTDIKQSLKEYRKMKVDRNELASSWMSLRYSPFETSLDEKYPSSLALPRSSNTEISRDGEYQLLFTKLNYHKHLVIEGINGIGKTSCTLGFIKRFHHQYRWVFFIRSDTEAHFYEDLEKLKKHLKKVLPKEPKIETVKDIKVALSKADTSNKWLLVIDDLKPSIFNDIKELEAYLPSKSQTYHGEEGTCGGHVLITSRSFDSHNRLGLEKFRLKAPRLEDCQKYIKDELGSDGFSTTEDFSQFFLTHPEFVQAVVKEGRKNAFSFEGIMTRIGRNSAFARKQAREILEGTLQEVGELERSDHFDYLKFLYFFSQLDVDFTHRSAITCWLKLYYPDDNEDQILEKESLIVRHLDRRFNLLTLKSRTIVIDAGVQELLRMSFLNRSSTPTQLDLWCNTLLKTLDEERPPNAQKVAKTLLRIFSQNCDFNYRGLQSDELVAVLLTALHAEGYECIIEALKQIPKLRSLTMPCHDAEMVEDLAKLLPSLKNLQNLTLYFYGLDAEDINPLFEALKSTNQQVHLYIDYDDKEETEKKVNEVKEKQPNIKMDCGFFLSEIVQKGDLELLRFLHKMDPDIIMLSDDKGKTTLHWATIHRQVDILRWLLRADQRLLNRPDLEGKTALDHAIECKLDDIEAILRSEYESRGMVLSNTIRKPLALERFRRKKTLENRIYKLEQELISLFEHPMIVHPTKVSRSKYELVVNWLNPKFQESENEIAEVLKKVEGNYGNLFPYLGIHLSCLLDSEGFFLDDESVFASLLDSKSFFLDDESVFASLEERTRVSFKEEFEKQFIQDKDKAIEHKPGLRIRLNDVTFESSVKRVLPYLYSELEETPSLVDKINQLRKKTGQPDWMMKQFELSYDKEFLGCHIKFSHNPSGSLSETAPIIELFSKLNSVDLKKTESDLTKEAELFACQCLLDATKIYKRVLACLSKGSQVAVDIPPSPPPECRSYLSLNSMDCGNFD